MKHVDFITNFTDSATFFSFCRFHGSSC